MLYSIADNFDEWMRLANSNPDEFERRRRQQIDALIELSAEDQQVNLRRYQWRIEQESRHHDNSLGYCISLSKMMSERMQVLEKQLALLHSCPGHALKTYFDALNASIVPLQNRCSIKSA